MPSSDLASPGLMFDRGLRELWLTKMKKLFSNVDIMVDNIYESIKYPVYCLFCSYTVLTIAALQKYLFYCKSSITYEFPTALFFTLESLYIVHFVLYFIFIALLRYISLLFPGFIDSYFLLVFQGENL